jgi:hypothetical protein
MESLNLTRALGFWLGDSSAVPVHDRFLALGLERGAERSVTSMVLEGLTMHSEND